MFLGAAAFFPDSEQRHEQLISLLQTSAVRVASLLLLYVSHSELCALTVRTYFIILANWLSLVAGKEEHKLEVRLNCLTVLFSL